MKKLILVILISAFSQVHASTYYVAPTGSDTNDGSILTPYKTVHKLCSVLNAGDIGYLRGGTYTYTNNAAAVHEQITGLSGTSGAPINIYAFPNELPVFNFSNIVPTVDYVFAFQMLSCSYVHLKGHIIIKNLKQVQTGVGISRGFSLSGSDHCTIEWLEIYNMAGTGLIIEDGSADNLILNCDSHHNGDGLSIANPGDTPGTDAWDNADAFSCTSNPSIAPNTSTRNTFRGCRGWLNSDDGWDFFGTNGVNTLDNCWSFWNGVKPWGTSNSQPNEAAMTTNVYATWHNNGSYIGSSGEGFKFGPAETQNFTLVTKTATNLISFENRGTGYASNSISSLTTKHIFYNCIAYKNDNDGFSYGAGWSPGATQVFKNCWSWSNNLLIGGSDWVYDGNNSSGISNNIWMNWYGGINYGNLYPTKQISNADFLSVSSVGMDGARQSDGSLPVLNFLRLTPTSDLVDAGVNVGIAYNGLGPDIGAFETPLTTVGLYPWKFIVSLNNGKVKLSWQGDPSFNSFNIQRGGIPIGTVSAVPGQLNYSFIDSFPKYGTNLYNVVGSSNGSSAYSPTLSVVNNASFAINYATLSPNKLTVSISSQKNQPARMTVYDILGRVVLASNVMLYAGANVINKTITTTKQLYYFSVTTNNQSLTTKLF